MKSGFVALLGRPNVGKSTIINSIVNHNVSIVTDKAQTTRNNIIGIYNSEEAQIVFLDTPGIHKPEQALGKEMNSMAYSAAHDVDVAILVVDASKPFGKGDQYLMDHLDIFNKPLIIVFNKIDLARLDKTEENKKIYRGFFPKAIFIDTVAKDRFNIDDLTKKVIEMLPDGPAYYPSNVVTDRDEVFHIKEIIREKVLKQLREEVPHAVAIYVNNIEWGHKPLHISASIIVEREGQKGIVIGAGGKMIKEIGSKARADIERLFNEHVFLELEVKVDKDWRDEPDSLKTYGYKYEK